MAVLALAIVPGASSKRAPARSTVAISRRSTAQLQPEINLATPVDNTTYTAIYDRTVVQGPNGPVTLRSGRSVSAAMVCQASDSCISGGGSLQLSFPAGPFVGTEGADPNGLTSFQFQSPSQIDTTLGGSVGGSNACNSDLRLSASWLTSLSGGKQCSGGIDENPRVYIPALQSYVQNISLPCSSNSLPLISSFGGQTGPFIYVNSGISWSAHLTGCQASATTLYRVVQGSAPQLTLAPSSLSFFSFNAVPPQTVKLTNNGPGAANFNVLAETDPNSDDSSSGWLKVSPVSGTLDVGQSIDLTVTADPTHLGSTTFTGRVAVTGGDAPQNAEVTFVVACPPTGSASRTTASSPGDRPSDFACSDLLNLSNPAPGPGYLSTQDLSNNGLKATITYNLQSHTSADLVLRVVDQDNNIRGEVAAFPAPIQRINPPANPLPSVTVTVPGNKINLDPINGVAPQTLSLKPLFTDPANDAKYFEGPALTYTVARDSIKILNPTINGHNLGDTFYFDGEATFECDVQYQLVSDNLAGTIVLLASDDTLPPAKAMAHLDEPITATAAPKSKHLKINFRFPPDSAKNFPLASIRVGLYDLGSNLLTTDSVSFTPNSWIVVNDAKVNNERVFSSKFADRGLAYPDLNGNLNLTLNVTATVAEAPGPIISVSAFGGGGTGPVVETYALTSATNTIDLPALAIQSVIASGSTHEITVFVDLLGANHETLSGYSFIFKYGLRPPDADYNFSNTRTGKVTVGDVWKSAIPTDDFGVSEFSTSVVGSARGSNILSPAAAPALVDLINPGTSTSNSFVSDTVDAAAATVLKFPYNNGLSLTPTTGVIPNNVYTIVTLLKFDEANKRRRILDLLNGASDEGLYATADNKLQFIGAAGSGATGPDNQITAGAYVQVALTRDANNIVTGYLNGKQEFQLTSAANDAVIDANNTLRFFQDNLTGPNTGEASAGSVARIRLYDRAMSAAEVAGLDREPSIVGFSSANYTVSENAGFATITVTRSGATTLPATVNYLSVDETAKQKYDYTLASGMIAFAPGETSKTFPLLVTNNAVVDGDRNVLLYLTDLNGVALSTPGVAVLTITDDESAPSDTNPIDLAHFFVQQHYYDFLSRYPDSGGWDFWTGQISNCGSDPGCNDAQRVSVSASFFLSIEFQQTGYLVERIYKTAYGDATGTSTLGSAHQLPVPIVRYDEFLKDTQKIGQGVVVLQTGWEQALETNKQAYASAFVQTNRFSATFPTTMTPAEFVDQLNKNAGNLLSASERTAAVNLFGGAGNTSNMTARAQALRQVAENQSLYNAEFNRAFVLTEYFGYLRRNPNDPQDTDYTGYDFWLTKLNQFNGNYVSSQMVQAFISSIEYRQRFGP
jgi:hypothetical protein